MLVEDAAGRIRNIAMLLEDEKLDVLALRVATARLYQTLTRMRGHMSDGRRMIAASPRLVTDQESAKPRTSWADVVRNPAHVIC